MSSVNPNRRQFLQVSAGAIAMAVPLLRVLSREPTPNPAKLARQKGESAAEMEFWRNRYYGPDDATFYDIYSVTAGAALQKTLMFPC